VALVDNMRIRATNLIPAFGFQLTVWFALFAGTLRGLGERGAFCDL